MLKKQITITIQEKTYEVKFPSTGQLIDIETMKVSLSKGMYKGLISANTKGSELSLDFIDTLSTFMVVIPDLRKDMRFDNILDISPIDMQELVILYKKVYWPWFAEWMEIMKEKEAELNKLYSQDSEKDV